MRGGAGGGGGRGGARRGGLEVVERAALQSEGWQPVGDVSVCASVGKKGPSLHRNKNNNYNILNIFFFFFTKNESNEGFQDSLYKFDRADESNGRYWTRRLQRDSSASAVESRR